MIPAKLAELVRKIEDSQLISYTFENKQVRFQLFHPGSAKLYSFSAPSDTVHGRSVTADPVRATCSIRLIDLQKRLDIKHERYFPPGDSKLVLTDAQERVTLAYGRRCAEHRWLFSLQGNYPLLSFLMLDLAQVDWEVE